jgi:hypothetical protein
MVYINHLFNIGVLFIVKFYFCIPLKPKTNSNNWNIVISNLKNTLNSIYNSSNQEYHVLIATKDPDDVSQIIDSDKTTLLTDDYDFPNPHQDKYKKIRLMGSYIGNKEIDPIYCMFLDADDLIHKDLVKFVLSDNNLKGYTVYEGFMLDISKKELRRKPNFDQICGSCYIGYFFPEEMPESSNDTKSYFSRFTGHARYKQISSKNGRVPEKVPFPSVVYFKGHEESLEYSKKQKTLGKSNIFKIIMYIYIFEYKFRITIENLFKNRHLIKQQQAHKLLCGSFSLCCMDNFKLIILGKRKFSMFYLPLKKLYGALYNRIKVNM